MRTVLIIGVIVVLVIGLPAIVWLTKLIRPPKPEEEAIHRNIAQARRDFSRRLDGGPRLRL